MNYSHFDYLKMIAILKGLKDTVIQAERTSRKEAVLKITSFEENDMNLCFIAKDLETADDITKNFHLIYSSLYIGGVDNGASVVLHVYEGMCRVTHAKNNQPLFETSDWKKAISKYCKEVHDRIFPLGNPKIID